ncbi:MAB_1171c family putative transporter [Streptomyces sp. C36]|uniref:MAB_1171c family putative transporter n=1 Tax=Streptomyces sp. C36 TaxID=3237122 RepID=UPI0034C6C576
MSEHASNIAYLTICLITCVIACWKGLAALRDPTPTLVLITTTFVCCVAVYLTAAPVGYRALGEAVGQPSFATLPVYIGILTCFAHLHLLALLWNPRLRQTPGKVRRTITAWSTAYVAAAVVMAVAFCSADLSGPADPLKFNTNFAHDPLILLFLTIFLTMLTCGTLSAWRHCHKMTLDDPTLQHAVRAIGVANLFYFAYAVCNAPAILCAALGSHALDTVGVLGSSFGATGALIASYGLSGAAVSAWLKEWRDIRALQPLWELVVAGVDHELAFSEHSARSHRLGWNAGFNLHRRVIEILDGIRALRRWGSQAPVEAVHALHARDFQSNDGKCLPPHEIEAIATAAALCFASERLQAARQAASSAGRPGRLTPPEQEAAPIPGENTPAADERARLLRVAQALHHPLVTAALHACTQGTEPAMP